MGLANNQKTFNRAIYRLSEYQKQYGSFAPKASMLVSGYTKIHSDFEKELAKSFGFESCTLFGSGFLANIALIESLCRKDSLLFMDKEYHASGILATRLARGSVVFFEDLDQLREMLKKSNAKKKIVAIEAIYSMSGRLAQKEVFDICNEFDALLIVDEAHSSGVLGKNLLGFFDYYSISPNKNHIKLGTLSKAYASYGAFVCASKEIISFLENRAKPLIYSTALSLFDSALGFENFRYIKKHKKMLHKKIEEKKRIVKEILGINLDSLILPIPINGDVIKIQKDLIKDGFLVGAIRPPTVKKAQLRVILKANLKKSELFRLLDRVSLLLK